MPRSISPVRYKLALSLLPILFAWGLAQAAVYHVSPLGNDAHPGTQTAPFREIRRALAVLAPGDTVLVADGSYKGFNAVGLGSASTVTTLLAPGRKAIITPTTDRGINDPNNIVVWNCTHFVIDGLQTFDAANAGMRIIECNWLTVRNGIFGNNRRWGIVTSHSNDLLIENNECHGSIEQHGMYVSNSGDRPVVRGNHLHHNAGSGLRSNGDMFQGGDGIISGAVYENNIIHDNGALGGAAMNLDGLQDGIIRNNLLYNNHSTGIALFKGGGAQGPKNMQVLHNTIIMPADARYNLRITDLIGPVVVRNNLLYNANPVRGPFSWNTPGDAALTDSDFNAFGGSRSVSTNGESTRITMEAWIAAGHEPHSQPSIALDNVVVSTASHDYRLKTGSTLIDRATPLEAVTADILGTVRPLGTAPDIGAYEHGTFDSWKISHSLPIGISSTSDTDGDGIPLLLEYALDLNPWATSRVGLPIITLSQDRMHLAYRLSRPDLQHQVETSQDLQIWTHEGVNLTGVGSEFHASASRQSGRRFMRLKVTLP